LELRYSAEEEKRDEQITIEIYQVGHWETGLAECSGQENITSNMQQSCGSSHGIAKACTDGLSSQQSAKTAEYVDFVNGPWKEIKRRLPALNEKHTYHPSTQLHGWIL